MSLQNTSPSMNGGDDLFLGLDAESVALWIRAVIRVSIAFVCYLIGRHMYNASTTDQQADKVSSPQINKQSKWATDRAPARSSKLKQNRRDFEDESTSAGGSSEDEWVAPVPNPDGETVCLVDMMKYRHLDKTPAPRAWMALKGEFFSEEQQLQQQQQQQQKLWEQQQKQDQWARQSQNEFWGNRFSAATTAPQDQCWESLRGGASPVHSALKSPIVAPGAAPWQKVSESALPPGLSAPIESIALRPKSALTGLSAVCGPAGLRPNSALSGSAVSSLGLRPGTRI